MNTAPRISIVIRCFNEEQYIGRLLTGILEQTEQGVEIIVVDSGSTDATVSIASRFPVTLCTIRPEDFSFGYALNKGIAVARGEFAERSANPEKGGFSEQQIQQWEAEARQLNKEGDGDQACFYLQLV